LPPFTILSKSAGAAQGHQILRPLLIRSQNIDETNARSNEGVLLTVFAELTAKHEFKLISLSMALFQRSEEYNIFNEAGSTHRLQYQSKHRTGDGVKSEISEKQR